MAFAPQKPTAPFHSSLFILHFSLKKAPFRETLRKEVFSLLSFYIKMDTSLLKVS